MEHRWRKRLQKTIKVMLYHNRVPVISCKTRDIGIEGIFVESGPLEFRNYTCLEIEFEGASKYGRRWYRLSVAVAHFSNDGLGLLILDNEPKAFEAWRHVVQSDNGQISADETNMALIPNIA